jgi:hypothetical protein
MQAFYEFNPRGTAGFCQQDEKRMEPLTPSITRSGVKTALTIIQILNSL